MQNVSENVWKTNNRNGKLKRYSLSRSEQSDHYIENCEAIFFLIPVGRLFMHTFNHIVQLLHDAIRTPCWEESKHLPQDVSEQILSAHLIPNNAASKVWSWCLKHSLQLKTCMLLIIVLSWYLKPMRVLSYFWNVRNTI